MRKTIWTSSAEVIWLGRSNSKPLELKRSNTTNRLSFSGGIDSAYINLYGKECTETNNQSAFVICAHDGTISKGLVGKIDGTLEWDYYSLSDIAVKRRSITNDGYISFSCGLIIQWGSFILTDEQLQKTFPIPISYTTQFYGLYVSNQNGTKRYFAYSNNLANITVGELTGYAANPLMWLSLGR